MQLLSITVDLEVVIVIMAAFPLAEGNQRGQRVAAYSSALMQGHWKC